MRVQVPAYTDAWMMGDRYGEVVKTTRRRVSQARDWWKLVHWIRLDKSGRTIRVLADDCTVID
jgi:hypothetical protein